jgi:hypothetical protein
LGIEAFESDRDVINASADRLMAYLKTLSTGDDATHAQQLLSEAAIARRCLLDPQLKTDYDAEVRSPKASPQPVAKTLPKAQSLSPRPAAKDSVSIEGIVGSLPAATVGGARKRRGQQRMSTARENNQKILLASAGACLVAVIIWIGIAVSSADRSADERASAPAERPKVADNSKAARPRKRNDESQMTSDEASPRHSSFGFRHSSPAVEDRGPEKDRTEEVLPPSPAAPSESKPSASAPVPAEGETEAAPKGTADEGSPPKAEPIPPAAPPGDPFVHLGAVLALPVLAKSQSGAGADGLSSPVTLGPLPVVNLKDVQFTVLGADTVFGNGVGVTVTPVGAADQGRWRVDIVSTELREHGGDPQALAEFAVRAGQLQFVWVRNTSFLRPDLLRNCLMEISADEHKQTFPLRQALVIPALTIQNEKGSPQTHSIPVGALPSGLPCLMEIVGISGPPPYGTPYPQPVLCTRGRFTNIQWNVPGSSAPVCAQIALDPVTSGSLSVRTRLLMQPPNEKNPNLDKPFNGKVEGRRIQGMVKLKEQYELELALYRAKLQGRPAQVQAALAAYEDQHAAQRQQFEQLGYLQIVNALCADKNLRENVRIHVNIYTNIAGHRLDLVRCEPGRPVK